MVKFLNPLAAAVVALVLSASFYRQAGVNTLAQLFSNQWQPTVETLNTSGEYDFQHERGTFLGKSVQSAYVANNLRMPTKVLGDSTFSDKRIEVDLSTQITYAYEGDTLVNQFLISSGKWGRTPTGTFEIKYKTRAQTMKGGSKALGTYYYLPNVQFVQFFGNEQIPWSRGFSFHGTYWHENFGTPMSHGCINMRNEDAEWLYNWSNPPLDGKKVIKSGQENPGTIVIIYGTPPKS